MFVYTIQPVVKPVWQPVWQNGCIVYTSGCQTGCTTRFDNRFDNRLYRVYKHSTSCQTGLTTGWMFVYTIQPVVRPVWQPVLQPVISCIQTFNWLSNQLYRVNGASVGRHSHNTWISAKGLLSGNTMFIITISISHNSRSNWCLCSIIYLPHISLTFLGLSSNLNQLKFKLVYFTSLGDLNYYSPFPLSMRSYPKLPFML